MLWHRMLTDRLKAALEGVEHLSPEAQDRLADEIADLLDEARWDAQFADPASRAFFDTPAQQTQQRPYGCGRRLAGALIQPNLASRRLTLPNPRM